MGRAVTGEFVCLPGEAMTFLGVLRAGGTVAAAKRRTDLAHDADVDALDFVSDLIGLGFVAAVDGERIAEEQARPPSLPWLRQSTCRGCCALRSWWRWRHSSPRESRWLR